jgi:DivIVA domain-containing protein
MKNKPKIKFRKAIKGYDIAQVDAYVRKLLEEIQKLKGGTNENR